MSSAVGETQFGSIFDDVRYTVRVTGIDDSRLRVATFAGTERLSELFRYRVGVATAPGDVEALEKARGRGAELVIERDGRPEHVVRGMVAAVSARGSRGPKTQAVTEVVLEPALARLRFGREFRIFQNLSAADIITQLLKQQHVECVWRVHPEPAKRDYCTQFGESDFDFVRRLASEEGAHFYFEDDGSKTVVVFAGDPRGYREVEKGFTLPYNDVDGAVTKDHVRGIQRYQDVTIGAFEHRAYDFSDPQLKLKARAEAKDVDGALAEREHRDFPGAFVDEQRTGEPFAKMRLEALRSEAFTLDGTASSLRLSAGRSFTLTGHRDAAFNRKLLLTSVTLQGAVAGAHGELAVGHRTFLSSFAAVPAETPIHPARVEKPLARLQTARVVGPKGGSPHVDGFGRVKVQFFWDREGKNDEHSSCWIRQMTTAAYADEGVWTPHKVGSEVVVDFLDGDIDQPLALGAVYNGGTKQPYKQPAKASRSTWKVRGIPGGTGFNEITFECEAGAEEIILHAQRDLNETVLRSHTEKIGANQTSTVGANQTVTIGANQTVTVGADRALTVKKNETVTVGADQTTTISGNHTASVGGDEKLAVVGSATKEVLVADTVLVGGVRSLTAGTEVVTVGARAKTVATGETIAVGGGRSATIGGDEAVTIGGARKVSVIGADSLETDATIAMTAKEAFQAQAGDDAMFAMNKDGEILFKTGDASILLKKSGDIEIKGKNLIFEAESKVGIEGDDVKITGNNVEAN